MRNKKLYIIVVLLGCSFLSWKIYLYHLSVSSLESFYEGGSGIVTNIDSFINSSYNRNGTIPNKKKIHQYLQSLDSEFLKDTTAYSLKIDNQMIQVYSFGISKKDNKLRNMVDARLYRNHDFDYKQNFTFISYLIEGNYDLLLFQKKF